MDAQWRTSHFHLEGITVVSVEGANKFLHDGTLPLRLDQAVRARASCERTITHIAVQGLRRKAVQEFLVMFQDPSHDDRVSRLEELLIREMTVDFESRFAHFRFPSRPSLEGARLVARTVGHINHVGEEGYRMEGCVVW